MNRLVIIGNGFDLAHGLKTTYSDFFNWFWHYCMNNSDIKMVPDTHYYHTACQIHTPFFELHFSLHGIISNISLVTLGCIPIITPWDKSFKYDKNEIPRLDYLCKNSFFETLLINRSTSNQWSDIEKTFFELLKTSSKKQNSQLLIKKLNDDFEEIKRVFELFLCETVNTEKLIINNKISDFIFNNNNEPFIRRRNSFSNNEIHILNFNYTNTPELYLKDKKDLIDRININYIHGKLNSKENAIIFGYGDERGQEYKELELLDNNDCFEHIKSFAYLNTPNYSKLIQVIDSESFDVVIIGHSCGLTDRTLLNTIFEHNNCKRIRTMFHKHNGNKDNYQDIVRNISRSFDDKIKMRRLVVDKTQTEAINQ